MLQPVTKHKLGVGFDNVGLLHPPVETFNHYMSHSSTNTCTFTSQYDLTALPSL